jgi:two-component system, OmpR family, sensor histidine kinase VanS
MASLSVGVAALTWVSSFIFLEPYYLALKRKQLLDISAEIGEIPGTVAGMYAKFASLERSTTVHISIVDGDGRVVYDSNAPASGPREAQDGSGSVPGRAEFGRLPPFAPMHPDPEPGAAPREQGSPPSQPPEETPRAPPGGDSLRLDGVAAENGAIFETIDPRLGIRLLFFAKKQASGSTLVLSFPLAQAVESARGAMLFLSLSSALALVMGALLSFVLAGSATRPFGELVSISRSIASLDFSRRFNAEREDETAILGNAMNELSEDLEGALAEIESANARLREDVERERRVDAMRRDFISSVSHELKTPIALILGYAEGIKEGVPGDLESRDAYLAVIIDEARKMDAQVRDLLQLSQIDSGALPLKLEDFDLRELVSETLASFDRALEERSIVPGLSLEVAMVRGDRDMLRRAVVNYFSNAISHVDESRVVTISLYRAGGMAEFSVFNSGRHIPEESLDLIWTSYYKVDPARNREFGGTGLGLAISRGIISRHGGSCSVVNLGEGGSAGESRRNGVLFSFRIPALPA